MVSEGKIETAQGISVVAITKFLMKYFSINQEEAYRRLAGTDFYELLNDCETGLYLEPDSYLCESCLLELEQGKEAMYEYINRE